jgi:tetratricopeptide (TPR) repeat protein
MLAKINSICGAIFFLALGLGLSGCTPAGPRALLQGKKYLDQGDTADALAQFKRATTLLATNANAWNYYGVALQRAGQPDEAANAYQTALKLNRDLVEAHFNLGSLALEQNKPEAAKAEFTSYTLRRPNDAAGWLKLGYAQLKAGESLEAEGSFSYVHSNLKANNAEAYNGLGLARIQRGKPHDAAEFFAAALESRPDFAPAILNLATVNHQYLHDSKAALENYHRYLALTPRPASYDDVLALVASLEQRDAAASVLAHTETITETRPKISNYATQHLAVASRPEPVVKSTPQNPSAQPSVAANTVPTQTVQVSPEPEIVTSPKTSPTVAAAAPVTNVTPTPEPLEVPMPEPEKKPGFWHRVFGSNKTQNAAKPPNHGENLTPIPATTEPEPVTKSADVNLPEEKAAPVKPAPAASFSHYTYTSPAMPAAGDRPAAEGSFTKARLAEQAGKSLDALQWYQSAAAADPSWFEAQYNAGVIAHRLRLYSLALPRYELALAIQPDSMDTRYNFALALKAAGCVPDAAEEFKKILAANPDEVRAHLALANLCAQSLHDPAQARQHYLKVLELQPDNSQASDIRFWLSANPK